MIIFRPKVLLATIVSSCIWLSGHSASAQDVQIPDVPPGVEVLARGPIHEAFAQPKTTSPSPGLVATKAPPAPIDELPPDQKPDGTNVQWIPGYWAWDDETNDYLWVSGVWRAIPPGRRWLPGHWQPIDRGFQWVAGFWAIDDRTEFQYLPPPPPTLETDTPASPAPDANSFYIPGTWVYVQTKYLWRPGYWVGYKPGWTWVPAYYVWTPTGCLFSEGYWDHPLDSRGLCFAPVHFALGWRGRYIPSFTISADFLLGALFVRGSAHHYYFGDYFDNRYAARGFVAWPDYRIGKNGYDPMFSYYRHLHVADPRWETGLRTLYRDRFSGVIARPPHDLREQIKVVDGLRASRTGEAVLRKDLAISHFQNVTALTSLKEVHNSHFTGLATLGEAKVEVGRTLKTQAITAVEREQAAKRVEELRATTNSRKEHEGTLLVQGKVPVVHTDPPKVVKLEVPKIERPAVVHEYAHPLPEAPRMPAHEERPVPRYEPARPPEPPRRP